MKIPLSVNTFTDEDLEFAAGVLKTGRLTMGTWCAIFEATVAKYIGRKHAIFVNSGSSANLLCFFLLANPDLGKPKTKYPWFRGCEVIVPALTWSTSIWPIIQAGGVPVLVDSDPRTLQMDIDQTRKAVTNKTVAVCMPHIMGNMVDHSQELRDFCDLHGLWLIEDSCEAFGPEQWGKKAGTFGDLSTFSFYFSHHLTTIEGGMVVTDSEEYADLLRAMRAHGWIRDMHNKSPYLRFCNDFESQYLFVTTGFNLRPTEINAALGSRQMARLDQMNKSRNESAATLQKKFKTMQITSGTSPAWFGFPLFADYARERFNLVKHLNDYEIETRPVVCGNIQSHPAMANLSYRIHGSLIGCNEVKHTGLYIGIWPGMSPEHLNHIDSALSSA